MRGIPVSAASWCSLLFLKKQGRDEFLFLFGKLGKASVKLFGD